MLISEGTNTSFALVERLKILEQFVAEEPGDPFNHYALALELLKQKPEKARLIFETLLKNFPAYLPTYYPFAHLLIEYGSDAEAEVVFREGQRMAEQLGDTKTMRELKSATTTGNFKKTKPEKQSYRLC